MPRAQGARAQLALGFESVYGTPPAANGFWRMPFASTTVGQEQPLLNSELLGFGRDPLPPVLDAITADGDNVVPIDPRYTGIWLKAAFGVPGGQPVEQGAMGEITFSAQPAPASTIGLDGNLITFVAGAPSTDEVQIGATLADTLANLVTVLNASVTGTIPDATYSHDGADTLFIVHDTVGSAGNTFTLSRSGASNAVLSAPTLQGGGDWLHEFRSGSFSLPSFALEKGMPDVPSFEMVSGCVLESLSVEMTRQGLITMTASVRAQGADIATVSAAGTLEELTFDRFGAFNGEVRRNGARLGSVTRASWTYANNLDPVETIRNDGKIEGADPTIAALTGQIEVRFANHLLLDQAVAGSACELVFEYRRPADGRFFRLVAHEVYLPRPRLPITGPAGVVVTFDFQAARAQSAPNRMCTAYVLNDLTSYDNPT